MKKWKVIFNILIAYMLIGGAMGLIKGFVPDMVWFNYRYLMGLGSSFEVHAMPLYAVVYGIVMAFLEVLIGILLLRRTQIGLKLAFITVSINALACLIAFLMGDIIALLSLSLRLFGLFVLYKVRKDYISPRT